MSKDKDLDVEKYIYPISDSKAKEFFKTTIEKLIGGFNKKIVNEKNEINTKNLKEIEEMTSGLSKRIKAIDTKGNKDFEKLIRILDQTLPHSLNNKIMAISEPAQFLEDEEDEYEEKQQFKQLLLEAIKNFNKLIKNIGRIKYATKIVLGAHNDPNIIDIDDTLELMDKTENEEIGDTKSNSAPKIKKTIILMDDEDEDYEYFEKRLKEIGSDYGVKFDIIRARHGGDTIDIYTKNPEKIDLIITDIDVNYFPPGVRVKIEGLASVEEIRKFENEKSLSPVPIYIHSSLWRQYNTTLEKASLFALKYYHPAILTDFLENIGILPSSDDHSDQNQGLNLNNNILIFSQDKRK
ncbi:MAG: hypothetical protein SVR08_14830, partial [Spirochaetota bacterium]|nr:hypothetical protein [Spirochaetota bacterium]